MAGAGLEIPGRVLGVDAALDGVAAEADILLFEVQGQSGGDAQLLAHQIHAGDELGDAVLHLDPGVHLHEVEMLQVAVQQEFHSAGALVVHGPGRPDGGLAHLLPQLRCQAPGGSFFNELLVAALHRAVPVPQMDDVAVAVRQHLELDVPGPEHQLLQIHLVIAEAGLGLCLGLRKGRGQILRPVAPADAPPAAAVKAAKAVGYENAGTVEFLLDPDREHFYFMEMNTRIQVEHGVTELVTGVDLVRQQLRIASGLALRLRQEDVTLQGHAIECRINAEDPVQGFRPCPGRVDFLHFPGGPGVRVDSCLYSGCELSPYYDSMAAKILAYAPTRMETIRRMRRCLEEFTLEGFPTNAELSYQILYHPEFILGECTTAFLDEHLSELLEFSRKLSESGVDA